LVNITEWNKKEGFHCCSLIVLPILKGFWYVFITGSKRVFRISKKYLGFLFIWRKKVFIPENIRIFLKKLARARYTIFDFRKNLPFLKYELSNPKDKCVKSTPFVVLNPGKKRKRLKFKLNKYITEFRLGVVKNL
jgi:hypothetical protein|tara:strand:+ start:103 stop:507 length:405 start_codon:yes stop_codon:yes gene_type:complete